MLSGCQEVCDWSVQYHLYSIDRGIWVALQLISSWYRGLWGLVVAECNSVVRGSSARDPGFATILAMAFQFLILWHHTTQATTKHFNLCKQKLQALTATVSICGVPRLGHTITMCWCLMVKHDGCLSNCRSWSGICVREMARFWDL